MAAAPFTATESRTLTVEEYLRTSYRPDCDFVDGVIEERTVGDYEHSRLQGKLNTMFSVREAEWNVIALPECRLQVTPDRFRVPDLMLIPRSHKVDRIVREAPLLCIEVLSPEDTWVKMRARLNDYLAMGVEHVWCFDPGAREVRRHTATGFVVAIEPTLTILGTPINIPIADVFAVLD